MLNSMFFIMLLTFSVQAHATAEDAEILQAVILMDEVDGWACDKVTSYTIYPNENENALVVCTNKNGSESRYLLDNDTVEIERLS